MSTQTFMAYAIPTPRGIGDTNSRQRTKLNGVGYELGFRWNARAGAWYLDLYDDGGTALFTGRKITVNNDLLGRSRPDGFPPGILWAQDGAEVPTEPGLRDLGSRVLLVYFATVDA